MILDFKPNKPQRGFSLVELMIAMTIGLFLSGAAVGVYFNNKQGYLYQDEVQRLHENGRFASDRMEHWARMAGYGGFYGDLSDGVDNLLNDQANFGWDLSNAIEGFNNVASNALVGGAQDWAFTAGSDVAIFRGVGQSVLLNTAADLNTVTIDADDNVFAIGDLLVVADARGASLFQATNIATAGEDAVIQHAAVGATPVNAVNAVSNNYASDAELGRFVTHMFYLSNGANGRSALFEAALEVDGTTIALQRTEMVPNVEDMQITYGEDDNSDRMVDVYRNAADVVDWANVLSIRFALLVAGEQDGLAQNINSYSFDAVDFTYAEDDPVVDGDRRLRRVFVGYAALRNRIL